jgi:hypothetical protein
MHMQSLYQRTACQIHQLRSSHASGTLDGLAYAEGRATILDNYLRATDPLSPTMNRLERLRSFFPILGPQEIWVEEQRMRQQSRRHPPFVPRWPIPLLPAPIPLMSGVCGRGSLHQEFIELPPPPGRPAAVTPRLPKHVTPRLPKQYKAICPGTASVPKNVGRVQLENFVLPYRIISKGGGRNGQLIFRCRSAGCTLRCRLVPVPLSVPRVYNAEVKIGFREHTNHNAEEEQVPLVPVLGPNGKSKGFPPLSAEVKLYIDELVELNPKTTPENIMGSLVVHQRFAELPFLTNQYRRKDIRNKVRNYLQNARKAKRLSNPVYLPTPATVGASANAAPVVATTGSTTAASNVVAAAAGQKRKACT